MKTVWKKYGYSILLLYLLTGFFIWPALGVVALICMLAPAVVALYKGRLWCGSYCPRGSLWDNVFSRINPSRKVPILARTKGFRIFMLIFIFAVFGVQMYYAWPNWNEVGLVFLRIILITTIFGIALALIYSPRTWCNFCPMGTLASYVSKGKKAMQVDNSCVNCKLCAKVCPMQLEPHKDKDGQFVHADCLKCEACISACPKKALAFENKAKG